VYDEIDYDTIRSNTLINNPSNSNVTTRPLVSLQSRASADIGVSYTPFSGLPKRLFYFEDSEVCRCFGTHFFRGM
jgi:hypothetical protein